MEVQPEAEVDISTIRAGLRKVKTRRLFMWLTIIAYMPVMVTTLKMTGSINVTAGVFAGWFIVLFIVTLVFATARCPRCGKYFHMNGMTLLFPRSCLHCRLHISGDKG